MSAAVVRSWLTSLIRMRPVRRNRRPPRTSLEVWQLEERQVPSTLVVLASFSNTNGLAPLPNGSLLEDSSSNLFGTTIQGGLTGDGTIYELANGSNTINTLLTFDKDNGKSPNGGLFEDILGNLYGTTALGGVKGDGTIFKLASGSPTVQTLASFDNGSDGGQPNSGLFVDSFGDLIGTASAGGASKLGTLFILPNGGSTIFALAAFTRGIGTPSGDLIEDSSGNFFGTTVNGGANNAGSIFELASGSTSLTLLASFSAANGASPMAHGLVEDSNGNLFGTTQGGGANGDGSVFKLAQGSHTITTLASFNMTNGAKPTGLIADGNDNLFGTTQQGGANGDGTVFELASGSNTITTLVSLSSSTGTQPSGSLIMDSRGNLFGTTQQGGANGAGTVFEADLGPTISGQPQSTTATVGQSASVALTAAAIGGVAPLAVQWQISTNNGASFSNLSNSTGVSGANSTLLTLSGFTSPGTPEYRAVFTDGFGLTATTSAATVTINAPLTITMQPQNAVATVDQPQPASFSITTSAGTGPLAVQWQVSTDNGGTFTNLSDGNGIAGSGTPTLMLSNLTMPGSAEYRAVVIDANGVIATSNAATLTVNPALSITKQPASQAATMGQTGSEVFSVVASNGTSPLSYQWQVTTNGGNTFSNLSDGSGISGSTTATLTISSTALPVSQAAYQVVVTDANGVKVTSTLATLILNTPPSITTQPENAIATLGQTAPRSFTITASGGTAPLTVQWQVSTDNGKTFSNLQDGNGITGTATTTLTVSSFAAAGSVEYRALVTDANGVIATSKAATLTVAGTPDQSWLAQVYADLLNRPLDSTGLTTWTTLLNDGVSRLQVVQSIESGLEYRTDVVEALYNKLLHRAADSAGLNGFTSFLGSGGTAAQVEAAIMGSAEYFQLHGGTNNGFLMGVYQDALDRSLDAGGAQSWGALLAGGSTQQAVARAILASVEAETDQVQGFYNQYLHRTADPAGLNGYLAALQQGVPAEQVIASILSSDEYYALAQ
jgi:uncharacterized repeat protein (TIGR03803 family)